MEHETCSECGFDGADYDDAALLARLRALGASWRAVLERAGAELRVRPAEGVWCAGWGTDGSAALRGPGLLAV